jgi:hypothetical protein
MWSGSVFAPGGLVFAPGGLVASLHQVVWSLHQVVTLPLPTEALVAGTKAFCQQSVKEKKDSLYFKLGR